MNPATWAAVAAAASLVSTLIGGLVAYQTRAFWKAERYSEVYDSVVRRPSTGACDKFVAETRGVLRGSDSAQAIGQFAAIALVYRSEISRLREVTAIPIGELADAIMAETTKMIDKVTNVLEEDEQETFRWESILASHAGVIFDLIAQRDPAIRPHRLGLFGRVLARCRQSPSRVVATSPHDARRVKDEETSASE